VTGLGVAPLDQTGLLDAELRQLRCSICNYGASCRAEPDRCPMCGSSIWTDESHRGVSADADSLFVRMRQTAATGTRVTLALRQAGSR
jgi:hypothetical protein